MNKNSKHMMVNIHTHFQTEETIEILNWDGKSHCSSFYSLGIHPWDASSNTLTINAIRKKIPNTSFLAIGEIGLDKIKGPDLEIQKNIFRKQISLSEEFQLPVIIHCVRSWNELKILKKEMNPKQTWIFHGFTKVVILDEVLHEGMMVSIGAAILSNQKLQECISRIPNDRLFLETDDSEISISMIYEKVSSLKNIPLYSLEKIIERNFKHVFPKWITGSNEQNC